jgi:hypothetical protein
VKATRKKLFARSRLSNQQDRHAATGCHLGRESDYFAEG